MAQQRRDDIKANFRTGDRPTEQHFGDAFDSFINIQDDNVSVDNNLNVQIGGSITLNNNGNARNEPGTIRWNGSVFEVYDPATSSFVPIGSGEGQWSTASGDDIFYDQGNVGIGPVSGLTDRFEVELDNTNRRVRTGNTSLGNGPGIPLRNYAVFSHTDNRDETNYAVVQGPNGEVRINAATGQQLTLRIGNQAAVGVDFQAAGGYIYINAPTAISTNSAHHLQLNGSAFKNDGNSEWDNTSDNRTKKHIQAFRDGLEKLLKIEPIRFEYNGKGGTIEDLEAVGVSAQEIIKVFPYMVRSVTEENKNTTEKTNYLSTNTSALKFVMINAIKELAERVENLEKSIDKITKTMKVSKER